MTLAERLYLWNCWYDRLPAEWRFHFVLWPLVALGTVNMVLSVAIGFPFALLVLLGILFFAAVRVPYILGWITPAEILQSGEPGPLTFEIKGADWLVDLNRRYDAMPEPRRLWVFPAILLIAGTINMLLTIWAGFPFGLIFLLALVAVVALRAPYAGGLLKSPPSVGSAIAVPYNSEIEHAPTTRIPLGPRPVESELPAVPSPSAPAEGTTTYATTNEPDKRGAADDRGAPPHDKVD